jgi:hypothetical protein
MRPATWLRRSRPLIPLLAVLAIVAFERQALACRLVAWSGFEQVAPRVWVDPELPAAQRTEVLRLVTRAQKTIGEFYGEYRARPTIIIGSNLKRLGWFGANAYASTHYAPWGAAVVIGPEGQNEDVVTHELAHPELFTRVGWWQNLTQVPTWFDEGLAMQFDHRETYDEHAWTVLSDAGGLVPLQDMSDSSHFFDEHAVAHYTQARHEVAQRLGRVGPEGVLQLIDQLAHGESFHDL